MQRFKSNRPKPKGRLRGAKKKVPPPMKIVQALVQRKSELEKKE
jgi:hypothetical protein